MHGLGSSQNYYLPLVSDFIKESFRCIVFDNTGAGRSSYTHVEQSIATLSQDVISILDALEVVQPQESWRSSGAINIVYMPMDL